MQAKQSNNFFITLPPDNRFTSRKLTPSELALLKSAITKIKANQLTKLMGDLVGVFLTFELAVDGDIEKVKKLLKLATLDLVKENELIEIFKINLHAQEEDKQIKVALKDLGIEDADGEIYKVVYRFRHVYYLDKLDKCKDNALAFPESLSERLLQCKKQTDYFASRFFRECSGCTEEELAILRKVYPDELLSKKIRRREAHLDISLTILEIHALIAGGLKKIFGQNKIPDNFEYAFLSKEQAAVSMQYTNVLPLNLIWANDLEKFILEKHSIHGISYHTGMTLLASAVRVQNERFVEYFIKSGADVNRANNTGYTPLHYACEGINEKILNLLLSNKCNVNCLDRGNYTPLYIATEMGKAKNVEVLLENRANLHLSDNRYMTAPLHLAVRNSDLTMVKILLASNKVNIFLRNLANETVVDIALQKKNAAEEAKEDKEVIQKKADILRLINNYINPPIDSMQRPFYSISTLATATLSDKEKIRANIAEKNLQLFSSTMNKSIPNSQSHSLLGTQPRKTTLTLSVEEVNNVVNKVKACLFKPKENKVVLEIALQKTNFIRYVPNPFPSHGISSVQESSPIHCSYFKYLEAENKTDDLKTKFENYVLELKTIREKGITFPVAYSKILKLIEKIRKDGLSLRAFNFEIYRHDFLEHLINLQEEKSDLQVAIEGEDIHCIEEILLEKPDRTPFTILYKKEKITELNFAIQLGKVASVTRMLEMAQKNSLINLGPIPDNAIELTEKNLKSILETNPAFKEAEDFHGLDIPAASIRNYDKLYKQLFNTVSKDEETVNYLFTKAEYNVIRVLIGESESDIETETAKDIIAIYRLRTGKDLGELSANISNKYSKHTPLGKQLITKMLAKKYLEGDLLKIRKKIADLGADIYIKNDEIEEKQQLIKELEMYKGLEASINTLLENQISYYQKRKYFRESYDYLPKKENIFKHATNKFEEIAKNKILATPDSAISQGLIAHSSTPQGSRKNIYWSQNSRLTSITPFRATAKHVIELKIHQAIKENLLTQEEVYSTPHFSAFSVRQKIPYSYVFIGEDKSLKTIYSVHHVSEKDEKNNKMINKKIHWYDYFVNNKYHSSAHDEGNMDEEIFINDNIKATAYRFMLHLRRIKGPFTSGTYYHYILDNYLKVDVLDSGIAAVFNVLNSEIKISKDLTIDHPAVNIVENKKAKCFERLASGLQNKLLSLIEKSNMDEFRQTIIDLGIFAEQLSFAVLITVELQNLDFLVYLLDLGVPINFENNKVLNLAIAMMEQVYDKNKGNIKQSTEFSNAFNIVYYLLYHGKADEHDPDHIRQTISADCFSTALKGTWSDMTDSDLMGLYRAIFIFDNLQIQTLLLHSVTKNLTAMFQMTRKYALLDLNQVIANRLGIKNDLYGFSKMYQYIDNDDIKRVEDTIRLNPVGKPEHYWTLAYAIRKGRINIVRFLFPCFKEVDSKVLYCALHLAIRFKQFPVFKCLIELGADINQINILGQKAIDVAISYECVEAVALLLEKDSSINLEQRIIDAIKNNQIQLVSLFIEKLVVKPICVGKKELIDDHIKLITDAVSFSSLEIFRILFDKYKNYLQDNETTKQFFFALIMAAAQINKLEIFNELLEKLFKKPKIAKSLFLTHERWLFGNIIPLANTEILISCLEKTMIENFNIFKKMRDKNNKLRESYLDVALLTCDPAKVEVIMKFIPTATLNTSTIDEENTLVSILRQTDNIQYLDFLLEKLPKIFPATIEYRILVLSYAILYGRKNSIKWFFDKELISRYYASDAGPLIKLIYSCFTNNSLNRQISKVENFQNILIFLGSVIGLDVSKVNFAINESPTWADLLFEQFIHSLSQNASLIPIPNNTLEEINMAPKNSGDVEIIEKNPSNGKKPFNQPQVTSLANSPSRFLNQKRKLDDDEPPEQPLLKNRKKDNDQNRSSVNNNNK